MANDKYYVDRDELENSIVIQKNYIAQYQKQLDDFKKIIVEMKDSSLWIDNKNKEIYINMLNDYLNRYEQASNVLNKYHNYLNKHIGETIEFETEFMK